MRYPLQQTGLKESTYQRPVQEWECGWAAEGRPCRMGPTHKGKCTAAAQASCTPRKEGDRWHCGRLDAFGGACEAGPLPDGTCCRPEPEHQVCQPRRCHRALRGRVTMMCVALAVGFLTMMVAGPWSLSFVSPGELTAAHSAIEPPIGAASNCGACHTAADGSASSFILAAFGGSADDAVDAPNDKLHAAHATMGDSDKCVTCHFKDAGRKRDHLYHAHSVAPARLEELRQSRADASATPKTAAQTFAAFSGPPDAGSLACAVCHHEHKGRHHDLTFLSDTSCQVCHSDKFESFAQGHPEFHHVERGRSGIGFNHQSHHDAHFGDTPFTCNRCHMPDAKGFSMLVRPYEQACAGCHNQGREDHHGDELKKNSLVVFQLPEMEFDDDVYWPMDTAIGEMVKPLIRLLLAGDEKTFPALKAFLLDPDAWGMPIDWEPDEPEMKVALATGMKRLIADLLDPDEASDRIRDRLARALDADAKDPKIKSLAEQLATVRFPLNAWQSTWLKQLEDDLAGKEVDLDEEPEEPAWDPASLPSGWYVDPADVSVNYGPTAHADPLLHTLIDVLAAHADPSSLPSDPKADPYAGNPAKTDAAFRAKVRTIAFQDLASSDLGGPLYASCIRCHTLDRDAGAGYTVNWRVVGRYPLTTGFGKFNHSPHMDILSNPNNCTHCHEMAAPDADPATVVHGFIAHRKQVCAECHRPNKAPDNCVTCHHYHMNRP